MMKPLPLNSPPILKTDLHLQFTVIEEGPARFIPRPDGTLEVVPAREVELAAAAHADFEAAFKNYDLTVWRDKTATLLRTDLQIRIHHCPKIIKFYPRPLLATPVNLALPRFHERLADFVREVFGCEMGQTRFNLWKAKCMQNPRWVAIYEEE